MFTTQSTSSCLSNTFTVEHNPHLGNCEISIMFDSYVYTVPSASDHNYRQSLRCIKNVSTCSRNAPYFLSDFDHNSNVSTNFSKVSNTKFHGSPSGGSRAVVVVVVVVVVIVVVVAAAIFVFLSRNNKLTFNCRLHVSHSRHICNRLLNNTLCIICSNVCITIQNYIRLHRSAYFLKIYHTKF